MIIMVRNEIVETKERSEAKRKPHIKKFRGKLTNKVKNELLIRLAEMHGLL